MQLNILFQDSHANDIIISTSSKEISCLKARLPLVLVLAVYRIVKWQNACFHVSMNSEILGSRGGGDFDCLVSCIDDPTL